MHITFFAASVLGLLLVACARQDTPPSAVGDVNIVSALRTLSVDVTVGVGAGQTATTRFTKDTPPLPVLVAPRGAAATVCVSFAPVGGGAPQLRRFTTPNPPQTVTLGETNGVLSLTGAGDTVTACP